MTGALKVRQLDGSWAVVGGAGPKGADSAVPGPQGQQGPAGSQGIQGVKGDKGDPAHLEPPAARVQQEARASKVFRETQVLLEHLEQQEHQEISGSPRLALLPVVPASSVTGH